MARRTACCCRERAIKVGQEQHFAPSAAAMISHARITKQRCYHAVLFQHAAAKDGCSQKRRGAQACRERDDEAHVEESREMMAGVGPPQDAFGIEDVTDEPRTGVASIRLHLSLVCRRTLK